MGRQGTSPAWEKLGNSNCHETGRPTRELGADEAIIRLQLVFF